MRADEAESPLARSFNRIHHKKWFSSGSRSHRFSQNRDNNKVGIYQNRGFSDLEYVDDAVQLGEYPGKLLGRQDNSVDMLGMFPTFEVQDDITGLDWSEQFDEANIILKHLPLYTEWYCEIGHRCLTNISDRGVVLLSTKRCTELLRNPRRIWMIGHESWKDPASSVHNQPRIIVPICNQVSVYTMHWNQESNKTMKTVSQSDPTGPVGLSN